MRPALTMCTLNSWLIDCDNTDSSAVDFWYLKPLKEASTRLDGLNIHVCKSVNSFLYELKVFVRQGANCSSGSMYRILADLDDGVKVSKVWIDQLYNLVRQRVIVRPNYPGNYGRLAGKAYEELFLPFHDAVEARDLEVVRRKYHEFLEIFNFGSWFTTHSEGIGSYYIASEHKKKVQQYIDDRFDSLEKWLDAEFETTSEQDAQIQNIQKAAAELLEQYEQRNSHSPDEYLLTIGWWVNELRHNSTPPVTSSGNRADQDNLMVPSALIYEHEFPWRCIESQAKHLNPTWHRYFADALSLWSNPSIESSVIQQWQDENKIECIRAYLQHSKELDNIELQELTHWVELKEVELKRSLEWDIKEVQSNLEGFQSDIKSLYQEELDDIKQCFNSKDWFYLDVRAQSLREDVRSALENYGKDEKRNQLCDDIRYLGGEVCNESELAELDMQLEDLLNGAEDRMVHITILKNLLRLPELPEKLREYLTNVIQMLNQPRYLPEADRAEWLKYILETAFSPFSENLAKPDILLPEYRDLLWRLFFSFTQLLISLEWVLGQNSAVEKILVQVSDRLEKEGSIDSVQSAKLFLDWFLAQCESFSIATLDMNWDSSINEHEEHNGNVFLNPATIGDDVFCDKSRSVLINALMQFSEGVSDVPVPINDDYGYERIEVALNGQKWDEVAKSCAVMVSSDKEGHYSDNFLLGAGVSLVHVLGRKDCTEVVEALLFLIDHIGVEEVPKILYRKSHQVEKNLLGTLATSW
ncbi:MAG: hypothetical protein KAS32_10470, partial [Candidatus Peribacteraceae bacterium]|nr:hypothetical protein [Candidatus Peribacteraceae bacterium]